MSAGGESSRRAEIEAKRARLAALRSAREERNARLQSAARDDVQVRSHVAA